MRATPPARSSVATHGDNDDAEPELDGQSEDDQDEGDYTDDEEPPGVGGDEDEDDPELEAVMPTAAELLGRNLGVSSLDELHAQGGAPVQYHIDLDRLIELCYDGQLSNEEMAGELGCTVRVIKSRKAQLGLTWLRQKPWLPDRELLQLWWKLNPGIRVSTLAFALEVSVQTLRRHMRRVGFKPSAARAVPDAELLEAVKRIKARKAVSRVGRTFIDGCLRSEFGIAATDRQIRKALRQVDPAGSMRRAKKAGKARRSYRVAGPRSLYHADAHEKIAKKYGIWLHLLLDGYSRFIIYLSAAPNKKSETVRLLYRGACDAVGWPSRCRWDKGSENAGARKEQLNYWRERRPHDWRERGSALTGRSVLNCRAEYVWVPVHEQVSGVYAERFDAMARRGVLDPDSAVDLHCLHAVFLRLVQASCNRFAGMWNHRKIRGERTRQGRGGGRPIELFNDPVGSSALLDDERAQAEGALYGQDVTRSAALTPDSQILTSSAPHARGPVSAQNPFRDPGEPEDTDLKVEELRTEDPLAELSLLRSVRAAYLEAHPLGGEDDGEADYLRYKLVCTELLEAMEYLDYEDTMDFDWPRFAASEAEYDVSRQLQLRWELANVALRHGLMKFG